MRETKERRTFESQATFVQKHWTENLPDYKKLSEEAPVIKCLCSGLEEQAALQNEHHKAHGDKKKCNSHSSPAPLYNIPLSKLENIRSSGHSEAVHKMCKTTYGKSKLKFHFLRANL